MPKSISSQKPGTAKPQANSHMPRPQNTNIQNEIALSNALGALQLNEHQGLEQGGDTELNMGISEKIIIRDPEEEEEDKTELHKLSMEHEKLIDVILEEEDQLVDAHKRHIDAIMELAKTVHIIYIINILIRKWHYYKKYQSLDQI